MKFTFPTGKEDGFASAMPSQRTGTGNMILWGVLAEILHGIDDLGAVLHLVKDDQGLFRNDFLPTGQHQILQDAVNILGGFKELLVFLVFVKVKIGGIFIVAPAEFFQYPGFPHLGAPPSISGVCGRENSSSPAAFLG